MKKIILVFSICILIMQTEKLKAQATWEFNRATWKTSITEDGFAFDFSYLTVDSINPDTVINAFTYKKIRNDLGQYVLAIRSDNHKLYGIDDGFGLLPHHEYLIYDFSANVGDTIYNLAVTWYAFMNFTDTVNAYVTAKDSFLLNNKYYQTLEVDLLYPGWPMPSAWYENIGSETGLVENPEPYYISSLVCYSNNDSVVDLTPLPHYPSDFTTACSTTASPGNPCFYIPWNNGIHEQSDNATIEIYPNPTAGEFRITNYESGIKSVKVVNVLGETVMNGKWIIENEQCVVDMSGRAKGIYFVRVETKNEIVNKKIVLE